MLCLTEYKITVKNKFHAAKKTISQVKRQIRNICNAHDTKDPAEQGQSKLEGKTTEHLIFEISPQRPWETKSEFHWSSYSYFLRLNAVFHLHHKEVV